MSALPFVGQIATTGDPYGARKGHLPDEFAPLRNLLCPSRRTALASRVALLVLARQTTTLTFSSSNSPGALPVEFPAVPAVLVVQAA